MKIEDIEDSNARHYLLTWICAFRVLLGWPTRRTLEWAERWEGELRGKQDGWLFHDTPSDYIASEIVQQLAGTVADWRQALIHRIERELRYIPENCWEGSARWDLFDARGRIEMLTLTELGLPLPKPNYLPGNHVTLEQSQLSPNLREQAKNMGQMWPCIYLFSMIRDGALPTMEELFQGGVPIDYSGTVNWTPLQYAVLCRRRECIRWLLEHGANPNARTRDGRDITALMIAAESGDEQIAGLLLKHGADINAASLFDWTALIYAITSCHAESVQLLLNHGARLPSAHALPSIYFQLSKLRGRLDIVEMLEVHGADFAESRKRSEEKTRRLYRKGGHSKG